MADVLGVLVPLDAPFEVLGERYRALEAAGVDQIWLPDHSGDYRDLGGPWFDGWTALAHAASCTTRVRVGTLVTNPILRPPALVARAAVAVDHLSGGRMELGIGTGVADFDHRATGTSSWAPPERAARFAEYVEVVDGLLRASAARARYRFDGRHHRTDHHPIVPPPVQRPRPPVTVGGQSPTVLRVAARLADRWNTHGPFGAAVDETLERTRAQGRQLDELCRRHGRDPAAVRRSLLCYAALDPWRVAGARAAIDRFAGTVESFRAAGLREFVVFWPPGGDVGLVARALEAVRGG